MVAMTLNKALFTSGIKMRFGQMDHKYPFTPGILINLFCPLSTTSVLTSSKGGVYGQIGTK